MSKPDDVKNKIKALRVDIDWHNHLYHVLNAPVIADPDFDALFQELLALEAQHPECADPNSPTARVGAAGFSKFEKIRHAVKMLSLDNVFSSAELLKSFEPGEVLMLEPKIDGLSLSLRYQEGRLVQAITRGDGLYGDDVTLNARTILNLPLVLSEPVTLEVRGEVYLTFRTFNALNLALDDQGEEPFANPRNAASGSLKLKDPMEVARRHLLFVAYGTPNEITGVETQDALVEYLALLNFQTPLQLPVKESCEVLAQCFVMADEAGLAALIQRADELRQMLDVATDGLVFKINSLPRQREEGAGTRAPKWAVAYKFPPERKPTKLLAITVQVGKSGKLTPVAELEPVALGGTVVRRASLCNQDQINRLGITPGCTVLVEKSADIIPAVVKVYERLYFDPKTGRTGALKKLLETQSRGTSSSKKHTEQRVG